MCLRLLGVDFDSEYRRTAWFSTATLTNTEPRGMRLSSCGLARFILPQPIDGQVPCAWWNVGSFYIMPVIALVYAVKFTFSRD